MVPNNFQDAFNISYKSSQKEHKNIEEIKESPCSVGEKVDQIISIKKESRRELLSQNSDLFNSVFDVTGAVKFEYTELINYLSRYSSDVSNFILSIIEKYCDKNGGIATFRNLDYYFQFDSLDIDGIGPRQSINNYKILDINIPQLKRDILGYLDNIDKDINIFFGIFMSKQFEDMPQCFSAPLLDELKQIVSDDNLSIFSDHLQLFQNTELDEKMKKQDHDCYVYLLRLKELIDIYECTPSENLCDIFAHVAGNSQLFQNLKQRFSIDVRSVLLKSLSFELDESLKKVYLGLLDVKINLYTFLQNISQIILNKNFMNPDFKGKLVFNASIIGRMKKMCFKEFGEFRSNQLEGIDNNKTARLYSLDMESLIRNYINILLNNDQVAYLESYFTTCFKHSGEDINRNRAEDVFDLIESLFELIKKLEKENDEDVKKRVIKYKDIPNKKIIRNSDDTQAYDYARNKLFRFFREEDDPLTMIKAAQNIYVDLQEKGFLSDHVMHLMSVNYGGSTFGYYAKAVFENLAGENKLFINSANMIYSLHDLKNADKFSSIIDYPYASFLGESENKFFADKIHWMVVLDDNTSSGGTLSQIRKLADETGFFENIGMYPCRANSNYEGYKQHYITEEEVIELISHCGYPAKRSKIYDRELKNNQKLTYKDRIGTIVGHKIYKNKKKK